MIEGSQHEELVSDELVESVNLLRRISQELNFAHTFPLTPIKSTTTIMFAPFLSWKLVDKVT